MSKRSTDKDKDITRRHIGRNFRPPCLSCKPGLSLDNMIPNSDNSCRSNDDLQKLSFFFSDPASFPSSTQSPLRSPTSFPALLSALPPNTRPLLSTISTPTPFDEPMVTRFNQPIFGFGSATQDQNVVSAFAKFENLDLTNFTSGNTMYFQLPPFFPCNPKNFNGTLASFVQGTNLRDNCITFFPNLPSIVTTPIDGQSVSFAMFPNVIATSDFCPLVFLTFWWTLD